MAGPARRELALFLAWRAPVSAQASRWLGQLRPALFLAGCARADEELCQNLIRRLNLNLVRQTVLMAEAAGINGGRAASQGPEPSARLPGPKRLMRRAFPKRLRPVLAQEGGEAERPEWKARAGRMRLTGETERMQAPDKMRADRREQKARRPRLAMRERTASRARRHQA